LYSIRACLYGAKFLPRRHAVRSLPPITSPTATTAVVFVEPRRLTYDPVLSSRDYAFTSDNARMPSTRTTTVRLSVFERYFFFYISTTFFYKIWKLFSCEYAGSRPIIYV